VLYLDRSRAVEVDETLLDEHFVVSVMWVVVVEGGDMDVGGLVQVDAHVDVVGVCGHALGQRGSGLPLRMRDRGRTSSVGADRESFGVYILLGVVAPRDVKGVSWEIVNIHFDVKFLHDALQFVNIARFVYLFSIDQFLGDVYNFV